MDTRASIVVLMLCLVGECSSVLGTDNRGKCGANIASHIADLTSRGRLFCNVGVSTAKA